jgi:hypothetical protein
MPQSGYPVSGPRFEASTTQIRRSTNHSTTTFGICDCLKQKSSNSLAICSTQCIIFGPIATFIKQCVNTYILKHESNVSDSSRKILY